MRSHEFTVKSPKTEEILLKIIRNHLTLLIINKYSPFYYSYCAKNRLTSSSVTILLFDAATDFDGVALT